jgi:hypothetical protein
MDYGLLHYDVKINEENRIMTEGQWWAKTEVNHKSNTEKKLDTRNWTDNGI